MTVHIETGQHYVLVNVKGGTAMDLAGEDNRSVVGHPVHRGRNQQWELIQTKDGWHIKNGAHDLYLAPEGDPNNNGTRLIAKHDPYLWHLSTEEGRYIRISVPNLERSVDLSDHGNPTPGNPIEIWSKWTGQNQLWIPERV